MGGKGLKEFTYAFRLASCFDSGHAKICKRQRLKCISHSKKVLPHIYCSKHLIKQIKHLDSCVLSLYRRCILDLVQIVFIPRHLQKAELCYTIR